MNKFAFIVHPLEFEDIKQRWPILRLLPDRFLKLFLKNLPAFKIASFKEFESKIKAKTKGCFITCPLTSKQLVTLNQAEVVDKIVASCQKAKKLGADIVGLGAFTAIVGDKGEKVAQRVDIPVTTGNSYTVAIALKSIELACDILGQQLEQKKVLVIGAAGSIGKISSLLLADKVKKILLADINELAVDELGLEIAKKTKTEVITSNKIEELIPEADIILSVSSAVNTLINPKLLKVGSIVCDVARPRDIGKEVLAKRDDVLVLDGGIVSLPGEVKFDFDFGFPAGTVYACMAENMILALEDKCINYSLGANLELEKIIEIDRLALKHGFNLASLRCQNQEISLNKINKIRQLVN